MTQLCEIIIRMVVQTILLTESWPLLFKTSVAEYQGAGQGPCLKSILARLSCQSKVPSPSAARYSQVYCCLFALHKPSKEPVLFVDSIN